jgi:hypothetical protein
MSDKTEGAIRNRQTRETSNIKRGIPEMQIDDRSLFLIQVL